jgi:N-methylhydantoinase A
VITLDLGGTTAKASIVEEGQFTRSPEYEVGAGIHMSSRLRKGNGYVLRVPSIDIAEIGAGGGSIVALDSGGMLRVGPRSAGAMPGPACYNQGGTEPCLTDCYLVLGYLNPGHLLGGDFKLDPERSFRALEEVARPLGMDPVKVAYGAYRIANSNMTRAITAVSSERGRDPRKFALFVFGGAGPLHGAEVAKGLGIKEVIIAPYAGIFSAFGFACGDIERYWIKGFRHRWDGSVIDKLSDVFDRLTDEAIRSSKAWGYGTSDIEIQRYVDLRYFGQASELNILLPQGQIASQGIDSARKAFDEEHHRTFGHSFPDSTVEVASLRLMSRIPLTKPLLNHGGPSSWRKPQLSSEKRKCYFGEEIGFMDTPVLDEEGLHEKPKAGPLLVEKYDTTIVIPPHCAISKAAGGCLIINISEGGRKV